MSTEPNNSIDWEQQRGHVNLDLLRENAELRAGNARMREAYQEAYDYYAGPQACGDFTCSCGDCGCCEMGDNMRKVLAETPTASLAAITAPLEAQIADLVAALNEAISLIDEKLLCVNPNLVPKGLVMKWEDCIAQSPAQALQAIQDAARAEERADCAADTRRIDLMEQHHIEMHCSGGPDLYHEGVVHPYEWTVGKNPEFGWGGRKPSLREAIDDYGELRNRANGEEAKCE